MTKQHFTILSQEDPEHKIAFESLLKRLPDYSFQVKYIESALVGKVQNSNPVLDQLENELALINIENLPFPLPKNLSVLGIVSLDKNQKFVLLASQDTNIQIAELKDFDQPDQLGQVYLVGAGQSDKKLLTLRAVELIQQADVIFYDSLIDKSILELSEAEKVFVGKRANKHFKDQKDINQLLFEAALQHTTIVRLKGGDPMIFGHAGEEIAFLEARLLKVETIPGVSSPLGAAAWNNLPLTLRNISDSVSFCSAHEKSKIRVPNTDTIVYFMGASNLYNIAKTLKKNGKPDSLPLTLFYNIGASDQQVFNETIGSVLNGSNEYSSPLLIVAGEVGDRTQWYKSFNYKPKILLTGTHVEKYQHLGYVYHQPMIEMCELSDFSDADTTIDQINNFHWVIFTSMYAVDYFFKRLLDLNKDSRALSNVKIASIGKVTSARLKKFGIVPDLQATEESSDGIIKLFKKEAITQKEILMPRSNLAMDYLPDSLAEMGNTVKKLTIYENQMPEIAKKVEVENFDQVIFTSPSGVDNFMKIYGKLPVKPELITRGKETQKRIDFYLNK